MSQDWFAQFTTSQPEKPKDDWFSQFQAGGAKASKPADAGGESKSFLSEFGRGLKDTALGAVDFVRTVAEASPLNTAVDLRTKAAAGHKLVQGVKETVSADVEKMKADPSKVGKVGRLLAMPLDVAGIPATGIADDLIAGNPGHALGTGVGVAALMKAPSALRVGTQRARGRLIAKPPTTARLTAPDVLPDVASRVRERVPAGVPADRPQAFPGLVETAAPDTALPTDATGRDLGGYAGPERRGRSRVASPEEDARYTRMREKLASGEQTGSPELREVGQQLSQLETFRDGAAKGRGETPLPRTAADAIAPNEAQQVPQAAKAALAPEERLYQSALDDARANGYQGTDAQLRYEFNRRFEQAKSLAADDAGAVDEFGPRALLEAIAKGGGIGPDPLFSGEVRALWENSTGFVRGQGTTKTGALKSSRQLPQGGLGGVSGVLRHGGKQLDQMVEYLRQDPRFANLIESPNDLLVAIEDAAQAAAGSKPTSLESALDGAGVRRGERWWEEEGSAARGTSAARTQGGDWFSEFETRGGAAVDDFDFGANADGGGAVPPGGDGFGGERPTPAGPEIPAQRPLSAAAKADEPFLAKLPDDVRDTLRAVWQKYEGFEDARRGVQPVERTQALADEMRAQPLDPNARSGAALAHEAMADYDRAIGVEREYQALKQKIDDGSASDAEWLRHQELDLERVLAAERVRKTAAEWGRTGHAIGVKVREYKALKAIIESHDPELMAEARAALQSGYFRQYVVGNLTSGIASHERNFGGNLGMAVLDTLATATAGRQPTAAAGMAFGMLRGLPRGLKEFAQVMREGGTAFVAESKTPFYREMPGGALNPWNDATRLLNATDRLFRSMAKQAEIDARAFREAAKLKTGEPFADRVARLRAEHPEWAIEADAIASNRLFQDRLGEFGKSVIQLRESVPVAGFLVAPFARISAKLFKMNAAYSPLPYAFKGLQKVVGEKRFPSALADDLSAPGRRGELARARALFGSAVLVPLAAYVAAGKVTGDGPQDAGKRALWLQSKQPNSIEFPDGTFVSYSGWPALSIPLAAMANAKETIDDLRATGQKVDERDVEAIAWNVLARTINSATSASFLSGLQDFSDALGNPRAYAQGWGSRLTTTVQPLVGLQRTIAQTMDPTVRAPRGVQETWQSNTPGLSKALPPRLDAFGEAVQREQSPLSVGILRVMKPKPDAVRDELQRLNVPLARPSGDITIPGRFPADIQDALRRLHSGSVVEHAQAQGRSKRENLERLILRDPAWWQSLSEERQKKLIAEAKADGTERANKQRIGTLYRDALLQQLSK